MGIFSMLQENIQDDKWNKALYLLLIPTHTIIACNFSYRPQVVYLKEGWDGNPIFDFDYLIV